MEDFENGVELQDEKAAAISSTQQITGYAAALAAATSKKVAGDSDTPLPLEPYSGSTFSPNTDENRAVEIYTPGEGKDGILRIVRTGKSDSQGGFIKHDEVLAHFGLGVVEFLNDTPVDLVLTCGKMQVSLVMANGKTLVGYVTLSKSRKGFYFPKKLAEQALFLPPSGQRLPIKVSTLIVG